jgi:hypothetical protein
VRGSLELAVGDPGSGKTGYLFYRLQQFLDQRYRCIAVSTMEDPEESGREPPMGCESADSLPDALEMAGEDRHVVIGYDEVGLEVDDNDKPSQPLKMLGRYRRHARIKLIMTTQRPHDLPAKVRDIDVGIVLMKMSDTSSYASQWVKRNYGEEVQQQAADLEPYWWKDRSSPAPRHGVNYIRVRG